LDTTDRRLLRGIYIKKLKDFDEELEDQSYNVTLLSRLKKNLMNLEMFTDPSPRKAGNNGSMEESYLSSEVPLPDGLNRLMKNSESPYDTERPLMLSKL
jgi:hypothetical protein